jgi:hypothetical protein
MSIPKLLIVGAGPRGIGLALRAIHSGIETTIVDPFPLKTWTPPNMLIDMSMRSPIGFDLVTFCSDLKEYSLSYYLGSYNDIQEQKEIEVQHQPISRDIFVKYLNHIWDYVGPRVNYIDKPITQIGKDYVIAGDRKIVTDNIAIALGSPSKLNVPNYARPFVSSDNLLGTKEIILNKPLGLTIAVIGSGQSSAEHVDYLTPDNKVIWVTNKETKVHLYPVPPYSIWGPKSALGDYFSRLKESDKKAALKYMKEVAGWTPSITPSIAKSLEEKSHLITKVMPQDINTYISKVDKVLLCIGFNTSLDNIPFSIPITKEIVKSDYPELNNFKSPEGIYFTGDLAKFYDGPRQGSLISIGITSKTIVEDILSNHYG